MARPFLPYGRQDITDDDIAAVTEVLKSPFLTTGPKVGEFETAFAQYVGVADAVAVANGTAALHLACLALGIGPGDTVLTPAMSFAASSNGAAYTGATVGFIDCDPDTGLITPQTFVEAADRAAQAGNPAKAAVVVHLNGEHADMEAISREAEKRSIRLIEDSCHALGTTFTNASGEVCTVGACRYSAISTYSTHPVKTITTGEGGVITTADPGLARVLRKLRNHGMTRDAEDFENTGMAFDSAGKPNPWYYEIQSLGYNYRLTDIACALGVSQMARMPQIARRRRELKRLYDAALSRRNLPVKPVTTAAGVDPVRHLYPILVDYEALGIERSTFCEALKQKGIGTQVHYIPTHLQPVYRRMYPDLEMPGAQAYYRRIISLPFYPQLDDADVERVLDAIAGVLESPSA